MPETRTGVRAALAESLAAQRGHLALWVPVCLALGIGLWFGLRWEPETRHILGTGGAVLCIGALAGWTGPGARPILLAVCLVGLGFLAAAARTHLVAAPVLDFRYYGPVEGRIVGIDRSGSDALRLTLDRVRLDDVSPAKTPARVRVSLHGEQGFIDPAPGLIVILTGHLSPPGGPVEPGGFDFQRHAWFARLGAVGYTRTPVLALGQDADRQPIFELRRALFDQVTDRIDGPAGAFVAAILTGDRSALPREDLEALRASNLAHLLAISGLHMGLLTGVVFGALRFGLALVPWVALRWPTKSVAAVGALAAGAFYLALSGGNVATIRAFIMVAVMLGAILAGRRAISLRSVALAATLILLMTPEALGSAGFQMSFAATIGLVAAFGTLRDRGLSARMPRWAMPVFALVVSSAVAGFATAPVGAAHFNRISDYGLLANLLSVPVMGTIVMPAAVAAAVLAPFGLEGIAFAIMRLGTEWILGVARWVAALDGAQTYVPAPIGAVLPLMALGALFWICWRGRIRHLGALPILAAFGLWAATPRPAVLIAEGGGLIGVMTDAGRALSKAKGDGFVAKVWLENDGDASDQAAAHIRAGAMVWDGRDAVDPEGALRLVHATGRGTKGLPSRCGSDEIWIVNKALERMPTGACRVFDPDRLRETGAVAIHLGALGEPPKIVTARDLSGHRIWNDAAVRAARRPAPPQP